MVARAYEPRLRTVLRPLARSCWLWSFLTHVHLAGLEGTTMTADHAAYIAQAPEELRPLLQRLRAQLARALPDAEEVISYKMPGFRIEGSIIAGYAAFSKQCGLYLPPGAIKSHIADIKAAGLKCTKTGVTFSPSQPIPDGLVRKLARTARSEQNL